MPKVTVHIGPGKSLCGLGGLVVDGALPALTLRRLKADVSAELHSDSGVQIRQMGMH